MTAAQSGLATQSPFRAILREIAPWMLLATTLRTIGVLTLLAGYVFFNAAELALFIAFLMASQRWIELTGGAVDYSGLGIMRRLGMAKGILLRITLLGFAAHYAAWFLGFRPVYTTPVVYGFDAIAFNRFNDFMLLWGPAMALATYLLVVEQAVGNRPTFLGAARQFLAHWRYLLPAVALLVPALAFFNTIQWSVGPTIRAIFDVAGSPALTAGATIVYLFAFASVRLAATVAVLTFALKTAHAANGPHG